MSAPTAIVTAFVASLSVLPAAAQDAPRPAAAQERSGGPEAARPTREPAARPQTRPAAQQLPGEPQPWPPGRYPGPQGVSVRVVPPEEVAQQASCVLQIEADAAYNPYGGSTAAIDARTAASVLRSTPVLEAAVKQAGGDGGGRRIQEWLVVNAVPTGQRFLDVEVILLKGDPGNELDDQRAAKILSSLCKALEGALRESADGQLGHAERRRAKVEQEVDAARKRLNDVRAKLRQYRNETAALGQHGGGDVRYTLNNLRTQRQNYEQQLAGNRSRLKQLQPSTSPLVAEWRSVVELRQKQLDEAKEQAAAGKATKESVQERERRLEDAKAQLEVARRAAAAEADQTRVRGGELASIENNIAQTEMQLRTVNDQLAKLEDPKTIEMLEEIPELQNEENRARNELNEATSRADQIRRSLDAGGEVSVRVLDGKPDQ